MFAPDYLEYPRAKGLQRERQQCGFLFGKHGGHLPFGGAVDARVGPALLPVIEMSLGFFQSLEAQAFQRCSLRVTDAGFDFAFAVGILNPARHGDRAVVRQHVAIKRIESGIVNVGDEHALAQIVEHDDASSAASPASSRTAECAGTCRSRDRAPSDRCRNQPAPPGPAR